MDTSDLIKTLTQDLKPVRRLSAPVVSMAALTVLAGVLVALVVLFMGGPRKDWLDMMQHAGFMRENALILLSAILSALVACKLVIPDTKVRKPIICMLAIATIIWVYICGQAALVITLADVQAELFAASTSAKCVMGLSMMMAMPLLVTFFMMTRAAPVWHGWAGYAIVLSMASFGALGMRFFCLNDSIPHLLLWHFLPIIFFSLLGIMLGQIVLRFKL